MKKILAIGNSFSQDATRYLHDIACHAGIDCRVVNLYIGGCSLEMHAENICTNAAAYSYELNGFETGRMVSVGEALDECDWDIVTVQQVSGKSGLIDTYTPFGDEVLDFVRSRAPLAKVYFHQTWAYAADSEHSDFVNYGRDQQTMHNAIVSASEAFAKARGLDIIPVGKVIAALRERAEFDSAGGGIDLCRDGFHLSMDYGRYAAGLVWFSTLLDGDVSKSGFAFEDADKALIDIIKETVLSA